MDFQASQVSRVGNSQLLAQTLLEITGLDAYFLIYRDLDEALRALAAP